jgi:hypothetical protein
VKLVRWCPPATTPSAPSPPSARLQGETDIAVVRADLLATINQTLEPAQLTVWLNPGPENGGQQAMPDPGRRP